ncbi:hypothetical protein TELCIR_16396, partial [Teladorsagia circumcincta]
MSIADEADPSKVSSEFHPLPSIHCQSSHVQQPQPTEDNPTANPIPPIPKPRTIKLSPSGTRKPLPPPRKPLLSSFVNIRPTQLERPPVNVIIDLNNSLWRNIQIQDMEKDVTEGDSPITIVQQQPSGSKVSVRPRNRRSCESASEGDIDSISVQMEDITSSEADSSADFTSQNFASDKAVDKMMMRMGPEWVVPLQYSNSPIVRELAESCEERPKPPSINHYAGVLTLQASASKTPPLREKKVTLLERIVRSHPIWEELQVRLCLPYAVLACETTKDLQSLALLGQ